MAMTVRFPSCFVNGEKHGSAMGEELAAGVLVQGKESTVVYPETAAVHVPMQLCA